MHVCNKNLLMEILVTTLFPNILAGNILVNFPIKVRYKVEALVSRNFAMSFNSPVVYCSFPGKSLPSTIIILKHLVKMHKLHNFCVCVKFLA